MTSASPDAVTTTPAAERKLLSLLFVDLSGYTRLTATRDPEDVQHTVAPLLAELRAVAEEHGGHVPSVQGDGFLTVFGAPTAHTDDPRRAVAAAVAMRAVVNQARTTGRDIPDVHVGVASGEVLVTAGSNGLEVVGAAVNLASRLSDAAGAGEILVDETTAVLTVEEALFGPSRAIQLPGFVGAIRTAPLIDIGTRRTVTDRLVGRTTQRDALDRALEAVHASGSSGVLVVTGEPGLGKTRLVESWLASHPDVFLLHGSCRPYGSPLPLSALSEAISAADNLPTTPELRDDYLRLLPRQRRTRAGREPDAALGVAARRLLEALSREGSTIVVLEDLHWADVALVEVLASLHADPVCGALLVVATSREQPAPLPQLALPALTSDEVADVVEERVGAPPEPSLLELLVDRSAGNPLWLVECLALLTDRGQLSIEGGRAVIRDSDGEVEVEVPSSIRMLVSARLDSLSAAQKRSLQRASVWPLGLPTSAWPGDPADLAVLQAAGLLQQRDEAVLRFSHGLVREAIYRSMPRADRVAEHEQVLAASTDPAARAYSAAEVHRLDVAPDVERRQIVGERALLTAVDHARHLRLSHTRAACDVLLRASGLVDELDALVPGACAALLTELATLLRELEDGRSAEVARRAVTLAQLAGDHGATTAAELTLGHAMVGTDNGLAQQVGERVLAADGQPAAVRARAWLLLGSAYVYDDAGKRLRCLERAYGAWLEAGNRDEAATAARRLAWNLSVTADEAFDRWFAAAVDQTPSDHALGQAELGLIRGVVAQARGDWEESWLAAEQAVSLMERVGMHQSLVDSLAVAVEAATATGRRAALPGLLARLAAASEGHRARLQVTALCASAPALVLLARDAEARRALTRAESLLSAVGSNEATMVWHARGHVAELSGEYAEAARAYEHAERLAQENGMALYAQGCRLQRYLALSRAGTPVQADDVQALAHHLDAARARALAQQARDLLAI